MLDVKMLAHDDKNPLPEIKFNSRCRWPASVQILMRSMLTNSVLVLVIFYVISVISVLDAKNRHKSNNKVANIQWTYQCDEGCCRKRPYEEGIPVSLRTCSMLCDFCVYPQLWPLPRNLNTKNKSAIPLLINNIKFSPVPERSMLAKAIRIFLKNLTKLSGSIKNKIYRGVKSYMEVNLVCSDCGTSPLTLETNETYELYTKKVGENVSVDIIAPTFYGMRHGLETLSQLIWWDPYGGIWRVLTDVYIEDGPAFPYRGLMIDTARNFFTLRELKKVITGMAASKLNTLHLHLTDSESFPLEIPDLMDMSKFGSYGPNMTYTQADMKNLQEYGLQRGVRLVLEIDAPGHVDAGWRQNLIMCNSDLGQLNPDNPEALTVLEKIYGNLLELNGQSEIFHIGGGEVDADCWRETKAAAKFSNMLAFQVHYMNQMIEKLKLANKGTYPKRIVLWSSKITDTSLINSLYPTENIVVQYWLGNSLNILSTNHSLIYSSVDHWYLDCGFGPWSSHRTTGSCDPYKTWRNVYRYRPWMEHNAKDRTLGGEVCMWSELVDDDLEIKLWPRVSAFAERMWSDIKFLNEDVYMRLSSHREILQSRKIKVAGIWPRWCTENPGLC